MSAVITGSRVSWFFMLWTYRDPWLVLRGAAARIWDFISDRESESPASRTTFSRLPYFCAPLPPDSRPSLCCSRLQVNQEDQKSGVNFQTEPKLNVLVHFPTFVLAGGSLVPDESCYRSVFLIRLSLTNRVITVWPLLLTSHYRDESLSSLCNVIAIGISKSNKEKTRGRRNV